MREWLYSSCFEISTAEHASVASRSGCSGGEAYRPYQPRYTRFSKQL
ncbi:MAG: hypothetical protein LBJ00_03455 [Planctomycetaceae bacterium]|nr:hypothetical protein [Planctomycetaceae bacterium]